MKHAAVSLALLAALAVAPAAHAFNVLDAVDGVWAADPAETAEPGDFTCDARPIALSLVDGGERIARKRRGDDVERYGLILDIRDDFPLGHALSIVWEDAPKDAEGAPIASVLVMADENSFAWIGGDDLAAHRAGAPELMRTPKRVRCEG